MRRCLRCGADHDITRDHVVSRVLLKQAMGGSSELYQSWSTHARDINIQPLCKDCNNWKGGKAIDYRTLEEHITLLNFIEWFNKKYNANVDIEIRFEAPYNGVRSRIHWCEIHMQNTYHMTEECPLFDDIPALIQTITERVESARMIEQASAGRTSA